MPRRSRQPPQFDETVSQEPVADDVQRMLARSLVERKEYARAAALLESSMAGVRPQAGQQAWKTATCWPCYEGSNATTMRWPR